MNYVTRCLDEVEPRPNAGHAFGVSNVHHLCNNSTSKKI